MDDRLMKEFIQFAQEKYGYTLTLKESADPDTFEKLFGISFLDSHGESVNEAIKNATCYNTSD